MTKLEKNKEMLELMKQKGAKGLLSALLKVIGEEGLISEDLTGEEAEYIQILEAKLKREIENDTQN